MDSKENWATLNTQWDAKYVSISTRLEIRLYHEFGYTLHAFFWTKPIDLSQIYEHMCYCFKHWFFLARKSGCIQTLIYIWHFFGQSEFWKIENVRQNSGCITNFDIHLTFFLYDRQGSCNNSNFNHTSLMFFLALVSLFIPRRRKKSLCIRYNMFLGVTNVLLLEINWICQVYKK